MQLPPGPVEGPAILSEAFTQDPLSLLARNAERYGPIFTLRLVGMPPVVIVADPGEVRKVFQDESTFVASRGNRNTFVHLALGENFLMALEGDLHRDISQVLRGVLENARSSALPAVRQALLARLGRWPLRRPFHLGDEVQRLALQVMLDIVLGPARSLERREYLVECMQRMLLSSVVDGSPNLAACLLTFFKARDGVYAMLDEEVAYRRPRGGKGRPDLLSVLIETQLKRTGAALTDVQLRDQLLAMSVTGHDTTAATTGFAFHEILRDPGVRAWIRDECEAIARVSEPGPDDLRNTPRLDAVLNETMRLHPVSPIVNRETSREVRVGRWLLPPGVMVCPCLYLAHRSADHFPDPDTFRKERFFGERADPFAFFPFGGGARRCIGERFARPEIKLILANTLVHAELAPGALDTHTLRRGFVLAAGTGVPVTMTARRRAA